MTYSPKNPNGSAISANSSPVVIASDQSTISVTATSLTDKSQFTKITDGTDTALVTAAGELNTLDTNIASAFRASSVVDSIGSTNSVKVHAHNLLYNGASSDRWYGDATNGGFVNVKASVLPTGAATETTLVTRLAESTFTTRIPVQGQATMAASIPVTISSNQSALPVTGTFFQATQPVSAASLPLPSGAATSALQSTQDTSINTLLKPANTLAGVTTVSTVTSLTQMNGAAISMNTGVRDAGTQRVTIATNDAVPVTDNGGSLTVDAPVGTPAFVRLSDGAAAITTLPVSLASVPSHAVTNVGTFATQVTAATTGGYTPAKLISAATTNATSVKASAGTIGYLTASNINASPRYLKIYNKASAPTVGTDVPVHTFIIPGNTAGAGTNIPLPPQGIALGTGIAFATTTGVADADTGAVASADLVINYGWI